MNEYKICLQNDKIDVRSNFYALLYFLHNEFFHVIKREKLENA